MAYNEGVLDNDGFPLKPQRIFVGIRRDSMPDHGRLYNLMRRDQVFAVAVRNLNKWEMLKGLITKISCFRTGMVVHLKPCEDSYLKNWNPAVIWVPNRGTIGVLIS